MLDLQHRYIMPEDYKKSIEIPFSIAELKTLQNLLLREIERAEREENAIYKNYQDLAQKLEYFFGETTR